MSQQNYHNHTRYYAAHHFIFYPLIGVILSIALYELIHDLSNHILWMVISCTLFLLGALSFMLRQHYSLLLQNRVVRLELRFRYYVLTQKRFETLENKLSEKQIFALRFASDEELPVLTERAINEKLSPDEIKQAIQHWLPDNGRV